MRSQTYILIICIIFFIFQRTALLQFGYSHISHPSFDEAVSGVLAYDLSQGLIRGPLFLYQYENRSGDSLIEGLLLSVFFKCFGNSLLSLKFLSLVCSFACLVFWTILIIKYFNVLSAIIFSLLYALPPPMFARLNLIGTIDSHHIINMLIPLQILILFYIIKGKKPFSFIIYMFLGFIMGFGTYLFYSYLIFNAFCAIFILFFKISIMSRRNVLIYFIGLSVGFMPWLLRSFYSPSGSHYLKSLFMRSTIGLGNLFQNFCFNVPHSLSYEYPSRTIGHITSIFIVIMLAAIFQILRRTFCVAYLKEAMCLRDGPPGQTIVGLFYYFILLFPMFFVVCLSFSPMQATPFEFWPMVGIFATFPPADIFQYRWMHILFPFYFSIIALGIGLIFTTEMKNNIPKYFFACLLSLILIASLIKTMSMCSYNDQGKMLYYKGYNFDQFAPRFIMSDFKMIDHSRAAEIAAEYPDENIAAAYQCLGTRMSYELIRGPINTARFIDIFYGVPEYSRYDFIYGIVRAMLVEDGYKHHDFVRFLIEKQPEFFYENYGFCYLGYKYYGFMINVDLLLKNMTTTEKWFFKSYILDFLKRAGIDKRHQQQEALIDEIFVIPEAYRSKAVKGLGKRIGAEMLFDPLHKPDYPLDSKVGLALNKELQQAFYEGIGAGFAETLYRYWRSILQPEEVSPEVYEHMLELEWQRCRSLMAEMPSYSYACIERGFELELQVRHVNNAIRGYITRKLTKNIM